MEKATIIKKYFPDLTEKQWAQFEKLEPLYTTWNQKINVISRKDIELLYTRHVLHALGIAKIISFAPDARVMDVGTGGGFPGIPLAILFPNTHFHLVDSIGKKITVVNQVVDSLALTNVTTQHTRVEQVTSQYDFIVSRAVTRLKPFYQWVKNKIDQDADHHSFKNGIFYLKGGDLSDELKEAKKSYRLFALSDYFEEPFFETKKVVYVPVSKK